MTSNQLTATATSEIAIRTGEQLAVESMSANTRRAYQSAYSQFEHRLKATERKLNDRSTSDYLAS